MIGNSWKQSALYQNIGATQGVCRKLMAAASYCFALMVVLSGVDLRQSLVFMLGGMLIGSLLLIGTRRTRPALVAALALPLLLTAVIDIDAFPAFFDRYQVALGSALAILAALSLLSRRWVFSLALTALLITGLVVTSLTKLDYVGAPLIWHDLLVGIRSWDLFLEMETDKALVGGASLLSVPLLWQIDRPVRGNIFLAALPASFAIIAAVILSSAKVPDQNDLLDFSFDAEKGFSQRARMDPVGVFVGSVINITKLSPPAPLGETEIACCLRADREAERLTAAPASPPHVVIILLESTFDPTTMRWPIGTKRRFYGDPYPLQVHTVGGGTWVAEYALMHGVPPTVYGPGYQVINLLGPGEADGRLPMILRSAGYATTTIYPVAGRFYGASTFHASVGMERFLDCSEVPGCDAPRWRDRPDAIFMAKALSLIEHARDPQFVFLPTIQQHSPHDIGNKDMQACREGDMQCVVMHEYMRRLENGIADFTQFQQKLRELDRDTVVLAFGDHIPGDVNRLFKDADFVAGKKQTFFTVWHSRRGYLTSDLMQRVGNPGILDYAYLDWVVGTAIGLDNPYFRQKEFLIRNCAGRYCRAGMPRNQS